jgi:hypothetical protein
MDLIVHKEFEEQLPSPLIQPPKYGCGLLNQPILAYI